MGGGISYPATGAGVALLACLDAEDTARPVWRLVATLTDGGWTWAITVFLPLALLVFPDGRLPSRRWRWVLLVVAVGGPALWLVGVVSRFSQSVGGRSLWPEGMLAGATAIFPAVGGLIVLTYLGVVGSLIVRFRRSRDVERQQLLWVMAALVVVATVFALDPVLPDSVFTILPIALVPAAILVAIFRHQLLDIRLVFSRSLVFLVLTGAAVGSYLGIVALLDGLVRTRFAAVPPVLATLAIAVAFNPVRVWLQQRVERAVYGARQDPVRALAEVGQRLGAAATPSPDGLVGVLQTLCEVLRLPGAQIVVAGTPIAGYGEPLVQSHRLPLPIGSEPAAEDDRAELVVGLRAGEAQIDPADLRVLRLLAAPLAVAVQAGQLATQLRDSREAVISGREDERRRLRRDLHDGLGPLLTGVVLNAEAALRSLPADPAGSAVLVARLQDQTAQALADIRRLVYDLRPPALDSMGLEGALREFALVMSRRADGGPLSVTVEAHPLPELPAAVEVAAYRIVTEALTNVTRHSSASTAVVLLQAQGAELHVGIHDDGLNLTGWQPGVGLASIRERTAELGGRCSVASDRSGARVDVYLALPVMATGPAAGSRRRNAPRVVG